MDMMKAGMFCAMAAAVGTASVSFAADGAAALRSCVADSDVSLQGPIGLTFERMFEKHVVAEDPEYLAACFGERTETWMWQTEFWGKYMHSATPFWTMTGCRRLKSRIDAGVRRVISGQQPDGYIGNYCESRRSAPGTWDVWGIKYTMLGLLHHYDATGAKESLNACRRLCDYLIKSVGPDAPLKIAQTGNYAGQPSCSSLEPVVWLYKRTKERKYLDFAAFIVKEMTEREDGPRLADLALKGVPVADRSPLPKSGNIWSGERTNRGKAYEMMSCYQGLIEYWEVSGRRDLLDAAIASARNIVAEEINLAGSGASYEHWYHGAKHQHEQFLHTQETCVTITWMRLCEKLLAVTGDRFWADELEKTFYNAYLASLSADGRLFAAYTPLDGFRSEGHIHCRMHTNCCNANGPRGFLSFMHSIAQAKGAEVFLNFFVSSRVAVEVPSLGKKAFFETHTLYPKTGEVDVRFRSQEPMKFKFSVRIPECVSLNSFKVNGKAVDAGRDGGRYVSVEREWKPGDSVLVDFALPVKMHRLGHSVAFTRGPVLLSRDSRFGDGDTSAVLRSRDMEQMFASGRDVDFPLELISQTDGMRMVVSSRLPVGAHEENPDGRNLQTVRFCDYASAGNRWSPSNWYRTWLPISYSMNDALKSE